MIQCQNCGQVNNQGSNFCRFCGTRMFVRQQTFQQQQQPPMQVQPQPRSFDENPPRPYSWKTDEYQVSEAKARKTQSFNQAQMPVFTPPQSLVAPQFAQSQIAYGYRCPRCHSQNMPRFERKISTAGWIVFAVLLVTFFPLFWIGLLIKEDVRVCSVCGVRV